MLRTALFIVLSFAAFGQELSGDQAIKKVYHILSGEEKSIPKAAAADSLLRQGAWEALAYLDMEQTFNPQEEDLQEAVPDYYRFSAEGLLFKLIDPNDYNQYGHQGKLQYKWEGAEILILSGDGKTIKDRWQLLYLDANYLALQMGGLRVFFTHTPIQE